MNNIALFDMDGSLADYDKAMLEELKAMASPGEPPLSEDFWALKIWEKPWMDARMSSIKSKPGFWFNLDVIEAGFDVFNVAKQLGFTNEVLTKGPKKHPLAWAEKLQWCQFNLGEDVGVHITCHKGRVYGKVLYDDFPDYMLKWLKHRPRGLGIMPITPYNKDFSHPQVIRHDGSSASLKIITEKLKEVYNG